MCSLRKALGLLFCLSLTIPLSFSFLSAVAEEEASPFLLKRLEANSEDDKREGWLFFPKGGEKSFAFDLPIKKDSSGLLLELGRFDGQYPMGDFHGLGSCSSQDFPKNLVCYTKKISLKAERLFRGEAKEDSLTLFINGEKITSNLLVSELKKALRFSVPIRRAQIKKGSVVQVRIKLPTGSEHLGPLLLRLVGYDLEEEDEGESSSAELPEYWDSYQKKKGAKNLWVRKRKLLKPYVNRTVLKSKNKKRSLLNPGTDSTPDVGSVFYSQRSDGLPALMGMGTWPPPSDPGGGEITSITWDFGDGVVSTFSPEELDENFILRFYESPGDYQVSVTAVDNSGDTASTTSWITVGHNKRPLPIVSVDQNSGNLPLTVRFSASGEDPDGDNIRRYWWWFRDGSPTVSGSDKREVTHTFTQAGVYRVKFRLEDEHRARAESYITIYAGVTPPEEGSPPVPIVQTSAVVGRAPLTVNLDASRSFDLEGGLSSIRWRNYGAYGSPVEWKEGERVEYVFERPGSYFIKTVARDEAGGEGEHYTQIHVLKPDGTINPTSRITTFDGDGPGKITFDWELESRSLQAQSYMHYWDFGDGTTARGSYQEKTYPDPLGNYTVNLTVVDIWGNPHRTSHFFDLGEPNAFPRVNFSIDPSWEHFSVPVVYDSSPDTHSGIDFGNGDGGDYQVFWSDSQGLLAKGTRDQGDHWIERQLHRPGDTYTRLIVTNENGLSGEMSARYTPGSDHAPNLNFTIDYQVCTAPCTVNALAQNEDNEARPYRYYWNFGDGSEGARGHLGKRASFTFETPGEYQVELTLRDVEGREYTHGLPVWVLNSSDVPDDNTAPTADFSFALSGDGSDYQSFTLNSSLSSDPSGDIKTYIWDFGDGVIEHHTGTEINHHFPREGDYGVRLKVVDNHGATSETTKTIKVRSAPPRADFSVSRQNMGNAFELTLTAETNEEPGGPGLDVNYAWNLGDGSNDSGRVVTHAYATSGPFEITLTVTDAYGRSSTKAQTISQINTNTPPNALFTATPTSGEAPVSVSFNASTSFDAEGIARYEWSFGDGVTATGAITDHTYDTPGNYKAQLRVIDTSGFTAEASTDIEITAPAYYDVSLKVKKNSRGGSFAVNFAAAASLIGSDTTTDITYTWDFGDGKKGAGETIAHRYLGAGPFEITVTAKDALGNKGIQKRVIRHLGHSQEASSRNFCLLKEGNKAPLLVKLDARCGGDYHFEGYYWDFAGEKRDESKIAFHRFEKEGTYPISLYYVNDNGFDVRAGSKELTISGVKPKVEARIEALDQKGRKGHSGFYFFIDEPPNTLKLVSKSRGQKKIKSYAWKLGSQTQTSETAYFTLTEGGAHTINLTVTDIEDNTADTNLIVQLDQSCPWGYVEGVCPYFEGYKSHIIPKSSATWTLKTTLPRSLANKAKHQEVYPFGWITLSNRDFDLTHDLKEAVSISGSDLTISKAALTTLGVDFTKSYTLDLNLIDASGDLNGGSLENLRFGIGQAVISFTEDNLTLEFINEDAHFYQKITTTTERSHTLSNLAVGEYVLIASKTNGDSTIESFRITDETSVAVPLSFSGLLRSSDKIRSTPRKGHYLSTRQVNKMIQDLAPDFDQLYQSLEHSPKKGEINSSYPWWSQRCDGNYPTQFPLFSDKNIDEFEISGVEGWMFAISKRLGGGYFEDAFNEIPLEAIDINENKRELTFLCAMQSGGSIHKDFFKWKYQEGAKACCENETCREIYQTAYEAAMLPFTHETTPFEINFELKDKIVIDPLSAIVEEAEVFPVTKRQSFLGAAQSMGLYSDEALINRFGLAHGVGKGVWAPTYTFKVTIPEKINRPLLKISDGRGGHPGNYNYNCFLALNKSVPKISYVGPQKEYQSSAPAIGSIKSNTRLLAQGGLLPVDVMPQSNPTIGGAPLWSNTGNYETFRSNYDFKFNMQVDFQDRGFGLPEEMDLIFKMKGKEDKEINFTKSQLIPCEVSEDNRICVKIELSMELGGNARSVADYFDWDKGNANQNELMVEAKARWLAGFFETEREVENPWTPLFNLYETATYDKICKHGHSGRPIAFGRGAFLDVLADVAGNNSSDKAQFRCNDISLPFGGNFDLTKPPYGLGGFKHEEHGDGQHFDGAYFYLDKALQGSTSKDEWRYNPIGNDQTVVTAFVGFAGDIREIYDLTTDAGENREALRVKCDGATGGLGVSCAVLEDSSSDYKVASIVKFCQMAASRNVNVIDVCTKKLTDDRDTPNRVISNLPLIDHLKMYSRWLKINRKGIRKITDKGKRVVIGLTKMGRNSEGMVVSGDTSFNILKTGLWEQNGNAWFNGLALPVLDIGDGSNVLESRSIKSWNEDGIKHLPGHLGHFHIQN